MKRLIIAATVAVVGLSYMTGLQAQTGAQPTHAAAKGKKTTTSAAQPKPNDKSAHCDQTQGNNHNSPCY
jgi:hypothetical protein